MKYVAAVLLGLVLVSVWLSTNNRIDRLTESVRRLSEQLDKLLRESKKMDPGYQYHSHYYANPTPGQPPLLKEVMTRRMEGESVADWNARHDARVAQARADYPPI